MERAPSGRSPLGVLAMLRRAVEAGEGLSTEATRDALWLVQGLDGEITRMAKLIKQLRPFPGPTISERKP